LLALEPDHRLHRERVVDALWPHLHADAGAANVHKAAHLARRTLGARDAIVLRRGHVELWPAVRLETDAERFELRAVRALDRGDADACRSAAALYGGELLPDERYEEWAAAPRERLHRLHVELLRAAGRWEEVVSCEPSDEEAARALMRQFAVRGQRAAVARAFERLQEALAAEFALEPSPETIALYGELTRSAPGKVSGRSHA
jgi:DNA-binding SARP family transcriptional activator